MDGRQGEEGKEVAREMPNGGQEVQNVGDAQRGVACVLRAAMPLPIAAFGTACRAAGGSVSKRLTCWTMSVRSFM